MKQIPFDPHTRIIDECYAVVYVPGRQRDRFSENCVEVMESMAAAKENANQCEPGAQALCSQIGRPVPVVRRISPVLSSGMAGMRFMVIVITPVYRAWRNLMNLVYS